MSEEFSYAMLPGHGDDVGVRHVIRPGRLHAGGLCTHAVQTLRIVAVDLYTHCGIRLLQIGGTWFERVGGLLGADGNPPPGWGNPTQRGQVTFKDKTAVLTDDRGHKEHFTPLPTPPAALDTPCAQFLCQQDACRSGTARSRPLPMPSAAPPPAGSATTPPAQHRPSRPGLPAGHVRDDDTVVVAPMDRLTATSWTSTASCRV